MAQISQYPFQFSRAAVEYGPEDTNSSERHVVLKNSRGLVPSIQAARLRTMVAEASRDPMKILAFCISYDGLSSRLVQEAGFPAIFLSGYGIAGTLGLPDTGYIAMQDVCLKIQESARLVDIPIIADGDTGYGSPMNVKRTVQCFAEAGAAGIMIEDQTWPKRCGHTKGKSVVSRAEAVARVQAACDARDEGKDIWILARTDALIVSWEETIARVREFKRLGVDAVFVEALPDRAAMEKCVREVDLPVMANIIEGGHTEALSARELSEIGFSMVAYPWMLIAAKIRAIRETLTALKSSMMGGSLPKTLCYNETCEGVGFNRYWDEEVRYKG